MESSSSMDIPSESQWPNLPSDILTTIATLVGPKIGHLRLRSICQPWRTALPLTVSPPFSVSLPSPVSPTTHPPLSLLPQTLYLLTTTTTNFLLNLQQTPQNNFSILTPFSSKSSLNSSTINLLNFGITFISVSYSVGNFDYFKKIVVSTKNDEVVVVLGLTAADGKLLIWKDGDEKWTPINHTVREFDDIASHDGKFYATANKKGRLVMIDFHEEKVIDLVPYLMYGCGYSTSLIGCDAGLYLIDRGSVYDRELKIEVFKLDEKGRFWDYEFDLNDYVFFLGDGVNLWLSPKDYHGSVRNVVYFNHGDEGVKVWDMKKGVACLLVDNEACRELFCPPSSRFDGAVAGIQ